MEKSSISSVQESIKSVEAEIKSLQSQLLRARVSRTSPLSPPLAPPSRRLNFPGLPSSHIELLEKLEYELSLKRQKKADLDVRTSRLQSQIDSQKAEIIATEKLILDIQSKMSGFTEHAVELQSTHSAAARALSDRKAEVKAMKRLHRDVTTTFSAVSQRKDTPIHERADLKPLRDELARLENAIRDTDRRITEFQEFIRFEETEVEGPIEPSGLESEILSALEDPEAGSIECDVISMRKDLKVKQQELLNLQSAVTQSHIRGTVTDEITRPGTPAPSRQKPKWHSAGARSAGWRESTPD
jgi:hypothetical protein